MNPSSHRWLVVAAAITVSFVIGCSSTGPAVSVVLPAQEAASQTIDVTILQLNDVYEITPVEGGKRGGLARVATIRNRLMAENPNTYTVLAGDFLSPSALGTARVDGERLAGAHMVGVLNAMGLDMVTFGNHEFDLNHERLVARIEESDFDYVAGNILDDKGKPIAGTIPYRILHATGDGSAEFRIAVLGVTSAMLPVEYVTYLDHIQTVKDQIAMLQDSADVFIAMTHLFLAQDIQLADEVPELALIMGGHEHENILLLRGASDIPIAKADANARSVYVHTISHDVTTGKTSVQSRIERVTDETPADPNTAAVIQTWLDRALKSFRDSGFNPEEVVATVPVTLDGRDSSVRLHPTRLTRVIAEGMRAMAGDVDLAVYNSGSIRIDDVISPGDVTQYDIIRVLPFGGDVLTVEMTGSLLDSVLTQGLKNKDSGGFLQTDGVREEGGIWFLEDGAILPGTTYRVAINSFLLSGREENLDYLTLDNPNVSQIARHGDIRFATIEQLRRLYPAK